MVILKSFVLSLFPLFVFAKTPGTSGARKDLYQLIKQKTNVSLKEAFQAVFEDNKRLIRFRLAQNAEIYGLKGIVKNFENEIQTFKQKCEKALEPMECQAQIEDLRQQKIFISDLENLATENPRLSLYRDLVIYSYIIRQEVLAQHYEKWSKSCLEKDLINTQNCKNQFYEIDILYAFARDLTQISYNRVFKQAHSKTKSELNKLVSRYE